MLKNKKKTIINSCWLHKNLLSNGREVKKTHYIIIYRHTVK